MSGDRRYNVKRWLTLRMAVLRRDLWVCQVVPGCPMTATVADHISPVYEGMPDWEFFDPTNLRAACKHHNLRRGHVARFQAELAGVEDARPRSRYTYGSRNEGRFFKGAVEKDSPPRNLSPSVGISRKPRPIVFVGQRRAGG